MTPNAPTYAIRKPVVVALSAGVLVILSLNVALVLQNRTLKKQAAAPPALLPQVGTRIERLEGVGLDGSKIRVPLTGQDKDTLLLVFSTRCNICNLNWPHWESIARSVQGKPYHLVYANITSALSKEYSQQHGIEDATVFAELDPRYEVALNLRMTPLTILLARNGEIARVWVGLLEDDQLSDLRQTLGLGTS